jgi:hypothetical protein
VRGLDRRAKLILPAWNRMLESLETGEVSDDFTDWFEISREDGRDSDVGFERHWIDPTVPLAAEILEAFQGQGSAIRKRDDVHKMAQANKAFAHFRW